MLAVFIKVNEQAYKAQLKKMNDHSGGKLLFLRLWDVDDEDSMDGQTDRPSAGKDSCRSSLECHQHTTTDIILLGFECVWSKIVEGSHGAINLCVFC